MLLKSISDLEKNFKSYYDKYLSDDVVFLQKYRKKLLFILLSVAVISIFLIIINEFFYYWYDCLNELLLVIVLLTECILIQKYRKKIVEIGFMKKFNNYLGDFVFEQVNNEKDVLDKCSKSFSGFLQNKIFIFFSKIINYFFFWNKNKKNKDIEDKNISIPSEYEISNTKIFDSKLITRDYEDIITTEKIYCKYLNLNISIARKKLIKYHFFAYNYEPPEIIFNGVMILIDLNKKFKSETIIKNKKFFNRYENSIYSKIFKKVNLEDSEFNKLFDVFSLDQIEARYLLTTSFMERLKKLKDIFHTNRIKCSFQDNKILIAIDTKRSMFEFGNLFKSINFNVVSDCLKNILDILKIIEVLKLNNNIGL